MRLRTSCLVVLFSIGLAACDTQGTVTVHSLKFKGVKSIPESRLKQALATHENSKVPIVGWQLPWSKKNYFDRSRFDADLQRIKAFYADRGYPDARVTVTVKHPGAIGIRNPTFPAAPVRARPVK